MLVQTLFSVTLGACSPSKCEDSGCDAASGDTAGGDTSGSDTADSDTSGGDTSDSSDDSGVPSDLHGTVPADSFPAPEFSVLNQDEQVRTRDDLLGHPTIVWFYPAAGTSG